MCGHLSEDVKYVCHSKQDILISIMNPVRNLAPLEAAIALQATVPVCITIDRDLPLTGRGRRNQTIYA